MRVDVRLDRETVWLTQRQMPEVFDTTPDNVLMHLRNVFSSEEPDPKATTKDFLVVRSEGRKRVRRRIRHYDLDAISVGYRVNSKQAVGFRRWATHILREHLVSGYTLNERRLALWESVRGHPRELGCRTIRKCGHLPNRTPSALFCL